MSMDNKPYVFISYAHLNGDVVLPCVEAMKRSGISLWYDEGIEAGSEWPEFIAQKVLSCTKFLLFVSNAYLNSQNCKRELNFAISRKKDILTIFLEDVTLSPGMEMQLGTYQAIYRKRFEGSEAFHTSLCREAYFHSCRLGNAEPEAPREQPRTVRASAASETQSNSYTAGNYSAAPTNTYYNTAATAQPQARAVPVKNRIVAALLALFLGGFGIHKFYLKQTGWGVAYLLFCWTYIPGFISFVEGIILLCISDEKFATKYQCRVR